MPTGIDVNLIEQGIREPDPTLALPEGYSPLDHMLAVMRDPRQPAWRRDRAARDAAPYCHPRLAVTAVVDERGFAERLDAAIARSETARQIERQVSGPVIEARPSSGPMIVANPLPPTVPTPTKMSAPFSTLRRI
jgi:hypothetical protein